MSYRNLRSLAAAAFVATSGFTSAPDRAAAGAEPFIGEIMMVGYTFCPRSWAEANGQLLPISQNAALFSLYGTQFGGDGRTTFVLPDLRGRVPLHAGQGPGLSSRQVGQKGGSETNTLTVPQLPPHSHNLMGTDGPASSGSPGGNVLANAGRDSVYASGNASASLNGSSIGLTGQAQPINNMPPFQVIRYCVALQGIFPSRN